ncbi:RHS repeat-associated core domain-containing protein [Clostridium sp. ZBS2]|uniref:RHS repeat-associated core domain-containing protein n=1 Tax=Clostridium sp. ZBS2 TaxID=2949976 RepID=UPI00207A2C78|nr:RHS repeat-associated core domain-containing protein [Clostridium sp. ZBS2]
MYNYTYNDEKLLESKSASGRTLISYTYDKNNNIKSIKDITGKSSIYSYDDADRVKAIVDDNKNTLAVYDYYKNHNIKSVTLGNGIKSDYTYDGDGNVESLVTITSNGEVLVDYKYAYDLNGNRLQKVSSKHKNFYSYDSMNRLVDSSYDGRQENFTYDKVGNRLTKTTNDITERYVYNVKNQLKELHKDSGINYFTYDKQGNTIKEETKDGNNIFEYNTLNQQVKAITKEGNTLVSRYDTEGLRVEIQENEKLSKFIFNKNGDILVESDEDYNVISRFTRGYEIVAADIADKTNSSINYSLSRYYYSVDEQGSTDFITDDSGNIKNEYYYDAFGNVLDSREEVHNRMTYTGQQFDGITQQYYLRARFYNPVIGRFTQEDVYRGDGLNLYAYCGNNPVRYYDPSGYDANVCKAKGSTQANNDHHKMYGEHSRNGEVLFDGDFISGSEGKKGRLNQQEALLTHTERKFLNFVEDDLEPGDKLKMKGTLPPCRPGCQPAIRTTVTEKQVNINYKASSNGYKYKWTPVDEKNAPLMNGNKTLKGSVIQQIYDNNGKQISSHRYWKTNKGRWKRAKY